MKKTLFTLVCFALLSTWADAQNSTRPTLLADRVRLMQANRALLEQLLDHGISLSNMDTELGRADECRRALVVLSTEVNRTMEQPTANVDRLSELTDHMTQLTVEGLVPTLEIAREQIAAGSPGQEKLDKIETQTNDDLQNLLTTLTIDPRLSRAETLRASLNRLQETLKQVKPAKK